MSVSTTHFLNGEWCSASNAKTFQVTNPATGEVVGEIMEHAGVPKSVLNLIPASDPVAVGATLRQTCGISV